jgi:inorganic pyrophosphatase/exopolyphosphatase
VELLWRSFIKILDFKKFKMTNDDTKIVQDDNIDENEKNDLENKLEEVQKQKLQEESDGSN